MINQETNPTLVFIHGMFQNRESWRNWDHYFTPKGFNCVIESWPLHERDPASLRANPPERLGDLGLQDIVEYFANIVRRQTGPVILIGHSVGGLVVQLLLNRGLGIGGVCISSVAPNKMLTFDWTFFRNSITITNPLKGDEPFLMDEEGFHKNFANTLSREDSDLAYRSTATHDSRNVLRDCMLEPGHMELDQTTKPMLFIGGEKDQIIPPELNKKNAEAYAEGLADFIEFPNRSHYICNEPGWELIADQTYAWIEKQTAEVPVQ